MNIRFSLLIASFLATSVSLAQNPGTVPEEPYIEVNGRHTMQVVPDRITINLTLVDKNEGREFISVESQEQNLIQALGQAGIPTDRISMENAETETISFRWNSDEIVNIRSYSLMLHDAAEIKSAFNIFKKNKIQNAFIYKVEHSQYDSLQQASRKWAMIDAKQKAEEMLGAIGETCGSPLYVYANSGIARNNFNEGFGVRGYRNEGRSTQYSFESFGDGNDSKAPPAIVYKKITFDTQVLVWFGIE
jgi:hypothetical protein